MTQVGSYPPRRARRAPAPSTPRPGMVRAARPQTPPRGYPPEPLEPATRVPSARPPQAQRRPPSPPPPRPHQPWLDDLDRRGSHATTYGQGFSWVLGWTILGALVPGSGLLAAGRRWAGGFVLAVVAAVGLVLAGLVLTGNPLKRGMLLAVNPHQLLLVAAAVAGLGLAWILVILLTNVALHRDASLTRPERAFTALVVLALAAGVALPTYKISDYALITRNLVGSDAIFKGDADNASAKPDVKKADPWAGKPRINVLLIGSDAGADRIGIRPDTMILASIDTKSGATVLFSLPRSLQKTPFPLGSPGNLAWPNGFNCGTECLLNAIWTWASGPAGRQYYGKFKNPGLRATEDAVQGVTGLKVDNYVMLNLDGFKEFVDAIGGVTVNVSKRLPIGGNGDPNSSQYHVATGGWIEPGRHQKMDGYRALWFARSRWMYDDYDRMQRQRCMIGAVAKKADPTTLALNFSKIASALKKNLSTGISTDDLTAWVELSQLVKGSRITSLPFTNKVISTVDPDIPKVHQLVQRAIEASVTPEATPAPSAAATPGASQTPKPKKPKTVNPTKAQDLTAVC